MIILMDWKIAIITIMEIINFLLWCLTLHPIIRISSIKHFDKILLLICTLKKSTVHSWRTYFDCKIMELQTLTFEITTKAKTFVHSFEFWFNTSTFEIKTNIKTFVHSFEFWFNTCPQLLDFDLIFLVKTLTG